MTKVVELQKVITESRTVYSNKVVDDLYVYRVDIDKKVVSGDEVINTSRKIQGLVREDGLKALETGVDPAAVRQPSTVLIALKNQLEAFRLLEWRKAISHPDYTSLMERCFDAYQDGEWSLENIVFVDRGTLTLRDVEGALLPTSQAVHYYSGLDSHNGRWDLDVMADHLKGRSDIDFFGARRNPDNLIDIIPYYNEDNGKDRYLGFTWQPSREDYIKVYERAAEMCPDRPYDMLQRAMFDTDILGLKAAGANLYEDYYAEVPVAQNGIKP